MRIVILSMTLCGMLGACSTRALRSHEELWGGDASPQAAAFLGFHGPVEPERPVLSQRSVQVDD